MQKSNNYFKPAMLVKAAILVLAFFLGVTNANYAQLTIVRTDDPSVAANLSPADKIKADAAFDFAARQIEALYNNPIQINITMAATPGTGTLGESSTFLE